MIRCEYDGCSKKISRAHSRCPEHRFCKHCEKPARIDMVCLDHADDSQVIRDTNRRVRSRRTWSLF